MQIDWLRGHLPSPMSFLGTSLKHCQPNFADAICSTRLAFTLPSTLTEEPRKAKQARRRGIAVVVVLPSLTFGAVVAALGSGSPKFANWTLITTAAEGATKRRVHTRCTVLARCAGTLVVIVRASATRGAGCGLWRSVLSGGAF